MISAAATSSRLCATALVLSLTACRCQEHTMCVCVYMWFGQRRQNTELERHRHRHADTHLERVSEVQSSAVDGNSRDGCLQLLAQCPHLLHTRGNRSSNVIRGLCTHTAEWELAEARGERRQHSAARAQPQGTRWGKGKAGGGTSRRYVKNGKKEQKMLFDVPYQTRPVSYNLE